MGEYSKKDQLKSTRIKPKRGNYTKITQKAREEVYRRSEHKCECCGRSQCYAFQVSHLIGAGQYGSGSDPSNLVLLCGPSVNSDTCHHWVDSTSDGREWKQAKKMQLEQYYEGELE